MWFILLHRLSQDYWMKKFEIFPNGEVYQFHAMLKKINKRGKEQIRFLVITNFRIYNMKIQEAEDVKRSMIRVYSILPKKETKF